MHVLKIVMREGLGSFLLGFDHGKQALECQRELVNPDNTMPRIVVKDDFGRVLDIECGLVGAVLIEDVEESTEMTIRGSLAQTLGQVALQKRCMDHPVLKEFEKSMAARQNLMNGTQLGGGGPFGHGFRN